MGSEPPDVEEIDIVAKLAVGLGSEMNTVLATIMGLASVVESDLGPDSAVHEAAVLERVHNSAAPKLK